MSDMLNGWETGDDGLNNVLTEIDAKLDYLFELVVRAAALQVKPEKAEDFIAWSRDKWKVVGR